MKITIVSVGVVLFAFVCELFSSTSEAFGMTVSGAPKNNLKIGVLGRKMAREFIEDAKRSVKNENGLVDIVIPDGVTEISERAFEKCSSLRKVKILGNMKVGSGAFVGCCNLREVVILGDLTNLGERVFEGCINLERIVTSRGTVEIKSASNDSDSSKTTDSLAIGGKRRFSSFELDLLNRLRF